MHESSRTGSRHVGELRVEPSHWQRGDGVIRQFSQIQDEDGEARQTLLPLARAVPQWAAVRVRRERHDAP